MEPAADGCLPIHTSYRHNDCPVTQQNRLDGRARSANSLDDFVLLWIDLHECSRTDNGIERVVVGSYIAV